MEKGTEDTKQSQKSSFIWDAEKKRPGNFTFIIVITMTIIFLIGGIISVQASFHDIKIVVDGTSITHGYIEYGDISESIEPSSGQREFSFRIRVGVDISVALIRPGSNSGSTTINLKIYDNGKLVAERTSIPFHTEIDLEYTVGE